MEFGDTPAAAAAAAALAAPIHCRKIKAFNPQFGGNAPIRGNMWAAAAAAAADEEFGNVREFEVAGNFDECALNPKWAKSNLDDDEKFEIVDVLSSILDAEPLDVSHGLGSSVDIGLLGGEFLFGDNCE